MQWPLHSSLLESAQANLLLPVLTCRPGAQRKMDWQRIDYSLHLSAAPFQKALDKLKCTECLKEPPAIREGCPLPECARPHSRPRPHAGPRRSARTSLVAASRLPWKPRGLGLRLETKEVAVCTVLTNGFSFMSRTFSAYCGGSATESKSTKRPNGEKEQQKGSRREAVT